MKKFFSFFAALLFAGSMMAETYTKTAFADLQSGDAVIITMAKDANVYAASNDKGTSAAPVATAVTVANDAIITDATDIIWTVVKDGSNISFQTGDNFLYCTNSNNGVRVGTNDNKVFSIDATSGYLYNNATSRYIGVYNSADFRCYTTVNSNISGQTLAFYAKSAGPAPAVATPVITGDAVFFDSTIVTMTCTTPEADIYYTTDGTTDPKCDCAAAPEYKKPIVLKATTTIKAAAYTGNDWSAVAEKVFTKAPSFASFEALIAAQLANNTLVEVSFENIKIDSIYVSSQSKKQGLYFTVGETAYEIYYNKAEVPETWEANGTVSGTIRGNWTLYQKANIWEIVPTADDWNWALNYTAPTVVGEPHYFVAGSMNSWTANEAYELVANPAQEGEYMGEFTFAANDEFKVIMTNGSANYTWYPDGETPNFKVDQAADYKIFFRPDGQGGEGWYYGYFNVMMKEEPLPTEDVIYDWAEEIGTTIFGGNSNITTGTVKIHENTDDVNGIKFGSSYVYADGKWIAIKPAEGGFKAGDVLSVSVVFNNSDVTKYCMVDVYAADQTTRLFRSDSASTLNGRNAGEPIVQTYTLAADQDSLFLGRYGNTGMFITLLEVTRAAAPVVEPVYTVVGSSAPLFGKTWDPAYEANNMEPIVGADYRYAWKKEGVALTAGTIEYKVCQDHGWATAWPAQGNYSFTIDEAGLYDVTIFFNPDLETPTYVVAEFKGSVVVLPNIILHGNFTGSWADTEAFTPAADSVTASLTLALAEGKYEFGFKFDGTWKANGANLTREANTTNLAEGSGNMFVTADVPGNYIFTYTYATQDVVVTYPEPVIVPDTIDVTMSSLTAPGSLIWDDEVATEGWWQIMGGNDTCQFSLSNGNTISTAAGTYTVADLDPKYSYITVVKANDTIDVAFVEGSITVAVDEAGVVTIVGALLGDDSNVYKFNLTYADPKAETTVNVTISNGSLINDYAAYDLYGAYGYSDDKTAYVQLGIWAENGFQGKFTEDDLDLRYIGSFVATQAGTIRIFSAAITVTPGNLEGEYSITADLLCYNNTLYKVTMTISAAQGIDAVEAATKAIKSLQNGILTIEKAGKTYNVNGTLIR